MVWFCNKIGAKFFTQPLNSSTSDSNLIDNSANIYTDSIISDTSSWVFVNKSFVADSAYTFLTLGFFFDSNNMTCISPNPVGNWGYYYLDKVCVSSDSNSCLLSPDKIPILNNDENIDIHVLGEFQLIIVNINSEIQKKRVVEIFNSVGQLIFINSFTTNDISISTSNWAAGIYILRISESTFKLKL